MDTDIIFSLMAAHTFGMNQYLVKKQLSELDPSVFSQNQALTLILLTNVTLFCYEMSMDNNPTSLHLCTNK